MRVLVLGGEGMLGHKMFQTLRELFPATHCTLRGPLSKALYGAVPLFTKSVVIPEVDVMDWARVSEVIRDLRPDYVVNCIGIIKQRPAAHDAIASITINSLLPHRLAELASDWGGRVIHFSTDCVFSGKTGGYTEDSPSDAEDLYGKSKFLGEVAGPNALTLRTSIVGRELSERRSLLEWFLSQRGKTIRGFKRVIYSGVTTNFMAELVGKLMREHPQLAGLYQVTSPPISKFDLLRRLREAYQLDVEILPDEEVVSDRSMVGDKFLAATGYALPSWAQLVDQLASDPTLYDQWREEP